MKTTHFSTKQEGYGRQGLYFWLEDKKFYLQSVFPNIPEHFGALYEDFCFYDEENNVYKDSNGHIVIPVEDWDIFLFEKTKERIGEVLYDFRLELEEFNYDFEGKSYEEIAQWAFNL